VTANVFDELACPECGGQIGGSGGDACKCFAAKPQRPAVAPPPPRRVPAPPPEPIPLDDGPTDGAPSVATPEVAEAVAPAPPPAVPPVAPVPTSSAMRPGSLLAATSTDGRKLCRSCGKDLTGRTRLKDKYGYICKQCADAEDATGGPKKPAKKAKASASASGSSSAESVTGEADLDDSDTGNGAGGLLGETRMECPECHRKLRPAGFAEYRGKLICRRCKLDHEQNDKVLVDKVELKHHAEVERASIKRLAILVSVLLLLGLIGLLLR